MLVARLQRDFSLRLILVERLGRVVVLVSAVASSALALLLNKLGIFSIIPTATLIGTMMLTGLFFSRTGAFIYAFVMGHIYIVMGYLLARFLIPITKIDAQLAWTAYVVAVALFLSLIKWHRRLTRETVGVEKKRK